MMKVIQGDRRVLEKSVLNVLMNPTATSKELDAAVNKLKPTGALKLVCSETKHSSSDTKSPNLQDKTETNV